MDKVQTRVIRVNEASGHIVFNIEPDTYNVVLDNYCFLNFDTPTVHFLHIDGLDGGSYTFPMLVNHSGYSTINHHYITTFVQPRMSYRITTATGAPADFTGQALTLVFQFNRVSI